MRWTDAAADDEEEAATVLACRIEAKGQREVEATGCMVLCKGGTTFVSGRRKS